MAFIQPTAPVLSRTSFQTWFPHRRHNPSLPRSCRSTLQATLATPDRQSNAAAPSVKLVSLGCPKNVTDAEVILGDLAAHGISSTANESAAADVTVINTCAFIEDAKRESLDAILEAARLKHSGETAAVIVTGCMAQRYADELASELPEVDAVVGFANYHELPARVARLAAQTIDQSSAIPEVATDRVAVGSRNVPFRPEHRRVRLGPRHSVYVRLAEGCSHSCTFCAIPGQFRGEFRSKPWDAVVSEVHALAESGARELVFIAEDTNQYGMDFVDDDRRLAHLLRYVDSNVPTVDWVRLLYCYPSYFSEELIDAIADLDIVCKYVDIPLQHISDRVLRRMQRPGRVHTERLLQRLHDRVPGLVVRTTFITGFPGETEEDHQELVDFVKKSRFRHAGFFIYSEEEDTPAADYADQVPMDVREFRRDELTTIQQQIQEEHAEEMVGSVVSVMVDRIADGHSIGRTRGDAPEIDSEVHILQQVDPGTILNVRILGTSTFDLYGEPVD